MHGSRQSKQSKQQDRTRESQATTYYVLYILPTTFTTAPERPSAQPPTNYLLHLLYFCRTRESVDEECDEALGQLRV